jgi:sarcosine oxidase gamma subunit
MSTPDIESVQPLSLERCFEFSAPWVAPASLRRVLPIEPGAVLRDAAGRAQVLYFAPHRWLVPDPVESLYRHLTGRDAVGEGALVDVEGKWKWFRLQGPAALRILESSMNVRGLLFKRSCAAGILFDCPVIVASDGGHFECWVRSSYEGSVLSAIGSIAGSL